MMTGEEISQLSETYRKAGDALHDALRACIRSHGGFINCSNNKSDKPDMLALVYNSTKGLTETFPIRAMRLAPSGAVELYIGTPGTVYTERYLRGRGGQDHWLPLKDSAILFSQTILSISASISASISSYLPSPAA